MVVLLPCRWESTAAPSSSHKNVKEGVSINSAFDSGNIEVGAPWLQMHVCALEGGGGGRGEKQGGRKGGGGKGGETC